ncbi:MAG: CaiB/BaiF CoA transferase family protein, partial [Nitrososphaerales archaeon]
MTPLSGIKVVDVSRVMAGPYCTMLLADYGADVIKVEPPSGDDSRTFGPPFSREESAYFLSVNRNKRSMTLNLKHKKAREIIYKLVESADVFVENYKPGVAKRLGIGFDALSKVNPNLIYASISGFGQSGPHSEKPGYDIIAYAMSGLNSITGEKHRPPIRIGVPVADIGAGMFTMIGILMALKVREQIGGQHIDMCLLDGQISWLTHQAQSYLMTGENPEQLGSAHNSIAPYQAFTAKDGSFVVAVGNDSIWKKFCFAIGLKDMVSRPDFVSNQDRVDNREKLAELLEKHFSREPVEFWISALTEADIPCGKINTISEIFSDPHIRDHGMMIEMNHEKLGDITSVGPPIKFSKSSIAEPRA